MVDALRSLERTGDGTALAALRRFEPPHRLEAELAAEAIRSIEARASQSDG